MKVGFHFSFSFVCKSIMKAVSVTNFWCRSPAFSNFKVEVLKRVM